MVETDDVISHTSPGKILLQGRLQAGLTQEQIAKELYMTVYKVKALESDNYGCLNSDTFARGYIRAYANLVKIDVVNVLAAYDQLMEKHKPQDSVAPPPVAAIDNNSRGAWGFLVLIGVFFGLLWLISVWFFDNHSDSQYADSAQTYSSVNNDLHAIPHHAAVAVDDAAQSDSSVLAQVAVNQTTQASMSTSSSDASVVSSAASSSINPIPKTVVPVVEVAKTVASIEGSSNAASVQASIASSMQANKSTAKKTTLDEISFSFKGESWLEVSDSRGDVLATELQPAGSYLKLVGRAPFDVKLGNAPVVDVQLNGKKFDVIPLMGSNVLILKIGN